jgi:hypothetical protein
MVQRETLLTAIERRWETINPDVETLTVTLPKLLVKTLQWVFATP